MLNRVLFWVGAIRAPFFVAVVVPSILGTAIAWWNTGDINWFHFILVVIGAMGVNCGTNLVNDYFDHKTGNDEINTEFISPFTGGSRFIQKGLLTPAQVFKAGLISFGVVAIIGIYLTWATGWTVLVLGIIGVFCGYFYSSPPFKLGHRAIAELVVGLNCGILVTLGAYWVQTQQLAWQPVIAAIPVSLLIAAVLWINEFPDYTADRAVGKIHLVGKVGKAKAAKIYAVMMMSTYVPIIVGVAAGLGSGSIPAFAHIELPILTLLGLLTLPLAVKATRIAIVNYNNSAQLAPANALTVRVHMLTGLLMAAGFLLAKAVQLLF